MFAPFAEFSPEWQAVSWAVEHGVPFEAIDLPAGRRLRPLRRPAPTLAVGDEPPPDPLAALAAAAGEPDPERWWEDLVEHRGDGEPVFDAVGEAMAAVRAGTVDAAVRRRCARPTCAVASGPRWPATTSSAVVCGAWHVPALDPVRSPPPSADAAVLRGRPKVKVAVTWVPWTHRRLGRATGYGAGVLSPGWYDHVFRHPGPEGVSRFFVDAAHALRRHGMPASPDHVIAASRLATSLAALRGPAAGRAGRGARRQRRRARRAPARARRARRRRRHRRGPARGAAGPAGPRPGRGPAGGPAQAGVGEPHDRARPAHPERAAPIAPAAPPRRPRRAVGCAGGGPGLERHVPGDVAADVGARAVGARRRARRPRHHRRGRGHVAAGRARRRRPDGWPTSAPPSSWRCSPTCATRWRRPCGCSASWPHGRPTSPS